MRPGAHERWSIAISAIAALTSVGLLLVVVLQMDRARRTLLQDGVLEFNFVQQTDHNLDQMSRAAIASSRATPETRAALAEQLLLRYDVIYPLGTDARRWARSLMQVDGAGELIARIERFVLEIEPVMSLATLPDADALLRIGHRSAALSGEVYDLGVQVFQQKGLLRDAITERMDRLITLFWFFGALFLVAGLTLYLLMARARRKASRLADEAGSARLQLESALEELTSGDIARKSRNRFLAAATHDLRQPLQAMQYYLAALRLHVPSPPGQEILMQIGRSTDAAQAMLTSLLDLSKLDAGVLEPQQRPVNVDTMLDRLCEEFTVEARERALALRCSGNAGWVCTDPNLLERILRNLIANALACTVHGSVSLRASVREGLLTIAVADTGIGIAQDELETIFNEYYQVENGSRNGAGLGLGLSIVRRLTRLLDIEVRVSSRTGRGTRFELDLPGVPPPDPVLPGPDGTERSPARIDRLAIMVIDDEQAVRDGLTTLLRQHGCHVICASSADDARQRLVASGLVPDLILADYQLLDGRTGLEAIDVVREEVNEEIPAIIVTGDTTPPRQMEARSLGIPLLHKPVAADDLYHCIDTALDPHRRHGRTRDGLSETVR